MCAGKSEGVENIGGHMWEQSMLQYYMVHTPVQHGALLVTIQETLRWR